MEIQSTTDFEWLMVAKREALITHITQSIQLFQASDRQKLRSLRQLAKLMDNLDGRIDFNHFNLIFKTLVRCLVIHKDSPEFISASTICAEKLSGALSLNALTDQVFTIIENDASKDSLISLASTLTLMKCLYSNPKSFAESPSRLLESVITSLLKIERPLIDQPLLIAAPAWLVLKQVIQRLPALSESSPAICEESLRLMVTIKASLESKSILSEDEFQNSISDLANRFGLTRNDFVQIAVSGFLQKLSNSKSYELWDAHSIERRQFTALMKHCSQNSFGFLEKILNILASCLLIDKDLETRFESLEVLHKIVIQSDSTVKHQAGEFILSMIVTPSLVWKVGKPNNKIRKAGVLCLVSMIKQSFIDRETVLHQFDKLLPTLKSCLSDDWAPDLRFATLELMCVILELLSSSILSDNLQDFYSSILDRLDDAQEEIRIKAAEVLEAIFSCTNCTFSSGIKEYILKILFIHFDDSNELLQNRIYRALKAFAGHVDSGLVLEQARSNVLRFRYPGLCQVLIAELEKISSYT